MKKHYLHFILGILLALALPACKEDSEVFEEPYPQGREPLGISIDRTQTPVPASGDPGTVVSVKGTGMLQYRDRLSFLFNGQPGEIVDVTDAEVKVRVPDFASSGVTAVVVDDVIVFGPTFTVSGRIRFDPTFRLIAGTNGLVSEVHKLPDGKMFVVGHFTNYDNKGIIRPINRIVRAFSDGGYDASLRSGTGANGSLNTFLPFNNRFIIAGSFSGYSQRTQHISNITMLHTNGAIDTMGVHTFRRPDQTDTIQYFPRFNGGTDGVIQKLYEQDGKILASGSFRYYISRRYDEPNEYETRDTVILDSVEVRQLVRFNPDGSLDKTYRFDVAANKSFQGGNGSISTYMHREGPEKGKLLVFGSFTTFDGVPAGYIARLNPDGTIDESFKAGSGANEPIFSATYNEHLEKYVITGNFRSYDGEPAAGIAVLNKDGTLDKSFTAQAMDGGQATFARMLDDGLIVVSGSFRVYDNITRNGFMVLQPDGKLAPGYNATGIFTGSLIDAIPTQSEDGKRALLLVGYFSRFDNEPVNNIVRIVLE